MIKSIFNRRWETNPIIVKELRSRMRGGRAFATLTVTLILLTIVGYAVYRMTLASSIYSSSPVSPLIGQSLFAGLSFLLLLIIAAITPSVTAAEISAEKEKQTYEMLMTTPLLPASILWGKLISSLSYVFLILFAAIPLASLVFIYGGVSIRDMVKTLLALFVIAVLFGVIGLFFSALFNRSSQATVVSYLVIALLLFGPLFAGILSGAMRQSDPPRWMLAPSPLMVISSTFSSSVNPQSISSAFYMLGSPIYWLMGSAPISQDSIPRPIYHYVLPFYLLVTILLYLLTSRLVKPVRRWQIQWSEAVLALVLILGFVSAVSMGYLVTTNRYENIQIIESTTPTPDSAIEAPAIP